MSRFLPMLAAVLFLLAPLGPYRTAMAMDTEAPVLATVVQDITGAFGPKIGAWLAAQERNDGTETRFPGAAPARTVSPFWWFCLGAATILAFIVIIRIVRRRTPSRIASRWTAARMRGGEPQKREEVFRELVFNRSLETLQGLLREEGSIRWEALKALGELLEPRAVPLLIQYLKNRDDRFAQAAAAEALANYGDDRRVIEALADTLASEETSFDVVQAAIRSLERWGDASTPSMIRLLTGNSNEGARRAALFLQDHPDSRASEALADVVRYAREDIRSAAAFALARLRDDRAIDQLAKDARGVFGGCAVRALRDMGNTKALETLTALLREGYEASEVVEALKALGWKPQSEIEQAAWLVGEGKYHLAADLGPAAIPSLVRFLADGDAREALGRILSEPQCRDIDDETLHRLTDLPDETGVNYVPNDSEFAQMPDLEVEYTISCAPLRDLAKQELARRKTRPEP